MPSFPLRLLSIGLDEVIHLHVSYAFMPEITWAYARLQKRPYVAHVHLDILPSGPLGLLLRPYKKLLLSRVLRDAAYVLVPTDDYRDLIRSKYTLDPDKVRTLRHGTEHTITERPKSLNKQRSRRRLLFVGRISSQKNIPLLLEAVAAYRRKYGNDIEASLVGDGELMHSVQAQIRSLALEDCVSLCGTLRGNELEVMYQDADLFLLTSQNESFGLVLIEAMAKGLPIVSVDIPAVRNTIINGENGLLVAADPDALATAVHSLLHDEVVYSAISKNNIEKARLYRWEPVIEELAGLYKSA